MDYALVFPGQGSQSLKMLDGLLEYAEIIDTFKQAQDILHIDFLAMLQEETPDDINNTLNTQPLLLAAGVATYRLWQKFLLPIPKIVAGHSLGEWSALVASGVIDFTDALRLVRLRAEYMQTAVPVGHGAMAAVLGLDDAVVVQVCAEIANSTGKVVAGVNFNSPGQVVIAGDKSAVEIASNALKDAGARKVQLLPVSVPSHCNLMLTASEKLEKALQTVEFHLPQIPVLHNFNVSSYTETESIKQALVKQLYMPVLWSKSIKQIVNMGITNIIECGPGKVLTGLNKRIDDRISSYTLHNAADFNLIS